MIVRTYGNKEIALVLVHGGPGAAGSLQSMAKQYACYCGVMEPWQSEKTVSGQVDELKQQIESYCNKKVVLVGHSWGAWIVTLFAAHYPDLLKSVVLLGSGMFDEAYLPHLQHNRLGNVSAKQKERYQEIVALLEDEATLNKDALMKELAAFPSGDDCDVFAEETDCIPDGTMYQAVWPEGARMRKDGTLLEAAQSLIVPIHIIHGENDPHPFAGITEPFDKKGIVYEFHKLPQCGHSPWKEKHAYKQLQKIIMGLVNENYQD